MVNDCVELFELAVTPPAFVSRVNGPETVLLLAVTPPEESCTVRAFVTVFPLNVSPPLSPDNVSGPETVALTTSDPPESAVNVRADEILLAEHPAPSPMTTAPVSKESVTGPEIAALQIRTMFECSDVMGPFTLAPSISSELPMPTLR